jgi:hypothetical protein
MLFKSGRIFRFFLVPLLNERSMFFVHRIKNWWTSRQRELFSYWDGSRTRRADPMRIAVAIEKVCPRYMELLRVAVDDVDKAPIGQFRDDARTAKIEAIRTLTDTSYTVFGLEPLSDAKGVTDAEAIGILTAFFLMMEDLAQEAQLFTVSPAVE